MNSSAAYTPNGGQRTPRAYRRPASIAELAHRAQDGLYEDHRDLKYHLRNAEKFRRTAKELLKAGDLEAAFVEYAKAATLVLEKLPTHRDYQTVLTSEQRHNLGLVRTYLPVLLRVRLVLAIRWAALTLGALMANVSQGVFDQYPHLCYALAGFKQPHYQRGCPRLFCHLFLSDPNR
jgi:hypothetical protein